jgi:hypothetical protein
VTAAESADTRHVRAILAHCRTALLTRCACLVFGELMRGSFRVRSASAEAGDLTPSL